MSKLWEFLSGGIQKKEALKAGPAFIHEAIDLKSYPMEDFLRWHGDLAHQAFAKVIRTAYNDYLITGTSTHPTVDILISTSSNGWIFRCNQENRNNQEYRHFMYLLYQRLKEEKYIMNLSDMKSQQKAESIEATYRYYLKPSIRNRFAVSAEGKKTDQIFGNITMEFITRDGLPHLLKFLANSYSDQNYVDARPFSDLMDIICEE